ncbi:Isomerase YbhE [Mycena venus]|uniref:Isomerase YbhE n=1 Tax=Mycena venus TaxID=2733690 RepID=A0A8H6WSX9_9AGAR|nr:Isomerase YbhE [Mycena venus]
MVKFTIYAGGYTSFIVSYLFDTQTSSLTYLDTIPTSANPSWLTPHPTNENIIYMTRGTGKSSLPSTGGTAFDNSTSVLVTFAPPPGGASNPHMALMYKDEIFVPDPGSDKIWRIGNAGAPGNYSIHGLIEHPKGTGPRHMAVLSALSPRTPTAPPPSSQTPARSPPTPPRTPPLPPPRSSSPAPSTAFPQPYIYVSNRNIGATPDPRGDTIGIFDLVALAPVAQVSTGLVNIRGMALGLGDAGEAYLVALGAVSGGMVVYERTEGGAGLLEVAGSASAVARTTLVMVPS